MPIPRCQYSNTRSVNATTEYHPTSHPQSNPATLAKDSPKTHSIPLAPPLRIHPDDRLRRLGKVALGPLVATAMVLLRHGLRMRIARRLLLPAGVGRLAVDVDFAVCLGLVGDVLLFCGGERRVSVWFCRVVFGCGGAGVERDSDVALPWEGALTVADVAGLSALAADLHLGLDLAGSEEGLSACQRAGDVSRAAHDGRMRSRT